MVRIACLPGDGIGVEVIREGVRVLRTASDMFGFALEMEELPYGADHYLATGVTLPEEEFTRLPRDFDAIYLGGLGDPRVKNNIHAREILLDLRFRLDLYINYRPIRLWRDRFSPLVGKGEDDLNIAVFRENTEGLYTGVGGQVREGTAREIATQSMICTYEGTERIIRAAFEHARQSGAKRVCMADKANALRYVGGLWRRVFAEVAVDYPEIETRCEYIDALCMYLIRCPEEFEVIVTGNLFGDVVTDLGAALQGGLGLAVSANLHPGTIGLFEPVHGTAPDIAGKELANPFAAILTGALMLRHCGEESAAQAIEQSVLGALDAGECTRDLGGRLGTEEAGRAVCARLRAMSEAS